MSELVGAVTASARRWHVDTLPSARYLQVEDELVEVEAVYIADSIISVRRGIEGTTAASHADGTELEAPVFGASAGGGGGAAVTSGVLLFKNASQTDIPVNNSPFVAVVWQVEDFDTDAYHAASGSVVTIPSNGTYLVEGHLVGRDDDGVDGQIYAQGELNTVAVREAACLYNGSENQFDLGFSWIVRMQAGDEFHISARFVAFTAASTWRITGSGGLSHFGVMRLGD